MKLLLPDGWPRPRGYSHGASASGRFVFVGGQIGWNADEVFESDDLADQLGTALRRVVAVLAAGGASPKDVVSMTWYVTDRDAYLSDLKRVGAVWRDVMGRHFPPMAVVEVSALMEPPAKIEIQAIAVVPA